MKLNPSWLADADVLRLLAACKKQGIELRFVGGAVRDALRLEEAVDVDAATPMPAAEVMEKLRAEGIKIVPTGLAHGTVSAVLSGRSIEITTLREDVETDGRHAKVRATNEWEKDAARRDFTMNALYLTADGELFDYVDGTEDALHGRVRFIGNAATRIAEDGLRMLRFFRFNATHGEPPVDEAGLAACRDAHWMMEELSGERIAAEMKKLLLAHNPVPALRLMEQVNVAAHIFPAPLRLNVLLRLTMLEHTASVRASVWGRCAALMQGTGFRFQVSGKDTLTPPLSLSEGEGDNKSAEWIAGRWKLSRKDARTLATLCSLPRLKPSDAKHVHTRVIRREGVEVYRDVLLLSAAENGAFDLAPWLEMADGFAPPVFPLTGEDMKRKGLDGVAIGEALERLEDAWERSDYTLSREALLAMIDE